MLGRKVDQSLQIGDGAVDEDSLGIMTGRMCWKDGIRSCSENEDIVWDRVAGGCLDGLVAGVDLGDARVEVVVEGTLFE